MNAVIFYCGNGILVANTYFVIAQFNLKSDNFHLIIKRYICMDETESEVYFLRSFFKRTRSTCEEIAKNCLGHSSQLI